MSSTDDGKTAPPGRAGKPPIPPRPRRDWQPGCGPVAGPNRAPPWLQKIQGYMDAAVEELTKVRAETISRSVTIVMRLVDQVEKELTPEQRPGFERMRPKPSDLSSLNLLNVEKRNKKP